MKRPFDYSWLVCVPCQPTHTHISSWTRLWLHQRPTLLALAPPWGHVLYPPPWKSCFIIPVTRKTIGTMDHTILWLHLESQWSSGQWKNIWTAQTGFIPTTLFLYSTTMWHMCLWVYPHLRKSCTSAEPCTMTQWGFPGSLTLLSLSLLSLMFKAAPPQHKNIHITVSLTALKDIYSFITFFKICILHWLLKII